MLISVVTPNYNHDAYLKQPIESVLDQTCPDIEVIILDDCSADSAVILLKNIGASQSFSFPV